MPSIPRTPDSFDLTPSSSSLAFGLLLPNSTIESVSQLIGAAGADGLASAGATPKVGLMMRMTRSPRPGFSASIAHFAQRGRPLRQPNQRPLGLDAETTRTGFDRTDQRGAAIAMVADHRDDV